jgi:hypothetical protein
VADGRKFGVQVGLAFLVLAGILIWRDHSRAAAIVGMIGSTFVLGGLLVPGRLGPVYRGWNRLSLAISAVTTPIIMAALYFLVMTPIGLIARAFGHRPLVHAQGSATFWVRRSTPGSDLEQQF